MVDEPKVAREIIDTMPEPEVTIMDERGDTFDKEVHEMGEDGAPRKTKKGFFHKKRGGLGKSTIAQVDTSSEDLSYQACGSSTAEIIFILGQSLGGGDWQPTQDERSYMTSAWGEYFKAKGVKDLPPGLIVATAMVSYAMPRFALPETKSRLQRAGHWLKMKLSKRYRKAYNESHIDSRNDGERQEHSGNTTKSGV